MLRISSKRAPHEVPKDMFFSRIITVSLPFRAARMSFFGNGRKLLILKRPVSSLLSITSFTLPESEPIVTMIVFLPFVLYSSMRPFPYVRLKSFA